MIYYDAYGDTYGMFGYNYTVNTLEEVISTGDKASIDVYIYTNYGTKFKMDLQFILVKYDLDSPDTTFKQIADAIYIEIVSNHPTKMVTPEKCIAMLEKEASAVDRFLITVINKMAAYSTSSTEPLKAIIEHPSPFGHSYHLGDETLCKLRDIMNHVCNFTHYGVAVSSILEYGEVYKIKVVTGNVAIVDEPLSDEDDMCITRYIAKSDIEFLQAFGNSFIAVRLYPATCVNKPETDDIVPRYTDKSIYPNDIMVVHTSLVEWA